MVQVPGYQIQQLLSWGAQGDVFLGLDRDGQRVAMKIVTDERADGDPQARLRLAREAKLLAAIDSPHVVKVRGFEQGPGWSCLVLEYLDGQRLDAAVRARAGLSAPPAAQPDQATEVLPTAPGRRAPTAAPAPLCTPEHVAWALALAQQLARGVAELHRCRLVHRDLKPQNAILVGDRAVLFDFGFARLDGVTTLTQAGDAIGTLAYMAPELLRGQAASECTDVHGLGATMHYCLTGAPPPVGDTTRISAMAARGRPPDVRRHNPAVDASFAAVIARCLEPDPRDRYPDAGAVLADLERTAHGEHVRPPFAAGRIWRHHRRAFFGTGLLAMLVLVAAWLFAGFDADDTAAAILAEVVEQPTAAQQAWNACDDAQRAAVTASLNERLGADAALAVAVAKALQLGLLRLQPRPDHLVALAPSNGEDPAPALPPAAFLPVDSERHLLVRPGRAWFFVRSKAAQHAWSQGDPRVLQLLVQVDVPGGEVPARSLVALPTDGAGVFRRPNASWVAFAAGDYSIRDAKNQPIVQSILHPFLLQPSEVPVEQLQDFRKRMAGRVAQRAELDAWLRHPDEPPAIADRLWASWETAPAGFGNLMPAQLVFWEAHRFAAWAGCRLPTAAEWQVANNDAGAVPGTKTGRKVEPLRPVDAQPTWDRTQRGMHFANSNVREWTLTRGDSNGEMRFVAVPCVVGTAPNIYLPEFLWGLPPEPKSAGKDPADPNGPPGLRLCRTRLTGP